MAIYNHSSNSSSHFRERMSEILDRMYPNTIPASRRPKGSRINSNVYQHIEDERKRKMQAIQEKQRKEANESIQKLDKGVHMSKNTTQVKSQNKK